MRAATVSVCLELHHSSKDEPHVVIGHYTPGVFTPHRSVEEKLRHEMMQESYPIHTQRVRRTTTVMSFLNGKSSSSGMGESLKLFFL